MNDNLLTVKQVAEIAGVSTQYIYKRLNDSLQPFVVQLDNKKLLKSTVITEFFENIPPPDINRDNDDFISYLKEEITLKNKQLDDKDKIIQNKEEQIKDKDRQIEEMANTAAELSERIAVLFENSQQLQQTQQLLEAQNAQNEMVKPKKSFFARLFGSKKEDKEKSEEI